MTFLQRRADQRQAEAAHAIATAVCPEPTCQVAPGTPCRHPDGRPAPVHTARYTETQEDTA